MDEMLSQNNRRCWLVVLPALVLPLAASFFYFVLFPGTTFGNSFYGGIKFFLLIWPILATGWILRESFRRKAPGPGDRRRSIIIGAAFGIATLMFGLTEFTSLGEIVAGGAENIREKTEGLGVMDHYVLFALGISIAHAALEEFYWRWFVFGNLRRLVPRFWAYLLAGAGFASHHIVVLSEFFPSEFAWFLGACVGIGGVAWSWIYQRTNTLIGPWISHILIDLGIFWIGYRLLFPN
jgi:membrane protease YdiL (CAAX protease family)